MFYNSNSVFIFRKIFVKQPQLQWSYHENRETTLELWQRTQQLHDSILLFRVFVVGCLPYNLDWHEISTNPLLKPTQQDFCKEREPKRHSYRHCCFRLYQTLFQTNSKKNRRWSFESVILEKTLTNHKWYHSG